MIDYPSALLVAVTFVAVGLAVALYRRERHRPSERDQLIAAAHTRAGLPPAADDNQAGTDLVLHDECELIYGMPALDPAWDAGRERLWDAVRDNHTTKGD